MLGYSAVNEATNIFGRPYHEMDTRLTASHTFSDLNFTTLLEVGITFILKLRNCYFETLNDLAKVSDLVALIP